MPDTIVLVGANSTETYAEIQATQIETFVETYKAVTRIAEKFEDGEELLVKIIPSNSTKGLNNGGN